MPHFSTALLAAAISYRRFHGVKDPDAEWGDYVLLRPWKEKRFLSSLKRAERLAPELLNADGNRAIMYCTTTDPYQVIRHPDHAKQMELAKLSRHLVRHSLELIRDHSTLNVRILTRSPMAREDFDIFKSFGKRLVFGMSLPTLRNDLSRVYEPKAPAPTQRLDTLRAAKDAGLHVYVAVAPTYPECDEADLRQTLQAIAEIDPITIFHEPINMRAENVARIKAAGKANGVTLNTDVFKNNRVWRAYARGALETMWKLADELGLQSRMHLWPDKNLGSKLAQSEVSDPVAYSDWIQKRWARISEWPA